MWKLKINRLAQQTLQLDLTDILENVVRDIHKTHPSVPFTDREQYRFEIGSPVFRIENYPV